MGRIDGEAPFLHQAVWCMLDVCTDSPILLLDDFFLYHTTISINRLDLRPWADTNGEPSSLNEGSVCRPI
jgi:hypothetical protein